MKEGKETKRCTEKKRKKKNTKKRDEKRHGEKKQIDGQCVREVEVGVGWGVDISRKKEYLIFVPNEKTPVLIAMHCNLSH